MAGTLNKGSLVKGTGGSGGGGSASFPTIVTDSGSSLPSASGYQLNDTFLNTSDKKIYKASASSYELNTGISINSPYNPDQKVNIDYTTGYASDFYYTAGSNPPTTFVAKCVFNGNSGFQWTGNKEIKIHFKVFDSFVSNKNYGLFITIKNGYSIYIILKSDGLYLSKVREYQSTYNIDETKQLLSCSWETDKEYYLQINKNEGTTIVTLSNTGYNQDVVLSNTLEITDYTGSLTTNQETDIGYINPRYGKTATTTYPFGVYLLDTTNFDYLVPSGALSWDTGTSLTDKTEYADKTNGALYLYENSELVKIGSSAPTVLTDQTSTSMALAGNTIYKWTSAITSLSFASAEVSDLETVLYFTTGGTISFTDSSSLKWGGDGSAPSLEANTIYCISIRNGLAEIDTFGTVS